MDKTCELHIFVSVLGVGVVHGAAWAEVLAMTPGPRLHPWLLWEDQVATKQPPATGVTLLAGASSGNQNYTSFEGVRMLSTRFVVPDEMVLKH